MMFLNEAHSFLPGGSLMQTSDSCTVSLMFKNDHPCKRGFSLPQNEENSSALFLLKSVAVSNDPEFWTETNDVTFQK